MRKPSLKLGVLSLGLSVSSLGFALDESRLWLPSEYERLYLDLKASAEAAEALDRCVTVLRGTLDLQQSRDDAPVFRIQCRQANGRTYNELVDGVTHTPMTTVAALPPSEEELEALKVEREAFFFAQCRQAVLASTDMFLERVFLTESPQAQDFTMESARFDFDFDAENLEGVSLSYKAICRVNLDEAARVDVMPRL